MNAERESLGFILSLGLNLSGCPSWVHNTIDHPVFLLFAARYSNAKRLRSKGELKQAITAPATIASQNGPSTKAVRDCAEMLRGQPTSTSARLDAAYLRIRPTRDASR